MKLYYTSHGSVRGGCGHKHRSVDTALRCGMRDQRDCASVGGYSDRSVFAVEDGKRRDLTDEESDYLNNLTTWFC